MHPVPGTADPPASRCAWCGRELPDGGRRGGRVACGRCGASTTDPWPSRATLERAYAGWYRPAGGRFGAGGYAFLRRTRGALAWRLDRVAPSGRVLDVGAGDGTLLDVLRARGREAVGLEPAPTRDDIRTGDILEIEEERFAAIVFWHSLEHLPSPGAALTHAAELLVPGGVLVVGVPNSNSLQARLFGDRWLALDLPRHLVHLPASTLLRRLDELGMRVTRVSHLRGGQVAFGWLHGLVGLLPGTPDLYDAIRRPEARSEPLPRGRRAYSLGSVYVEAVRG